jgi:myo-inositol 2-dehydrogenase / D-chiro-inositol 1-dehydrogenase
MAAVFRLGLAGGGRMGRTHLRALAGSGLVRIAAIAEPSAQARAELAGAGPALYPGLPQMLAGESLDGVLIAAPTPLHGQLIAEVAAAGLPVICEKPCGMTSGQARAAAQAAAAAGVPLQIAYWRRYVPALAALRERLLGGEIGDIQLVSCYQWDEAPPPPAFRAASGGIAIDMGVHEFDQIRWLTGQDLRVTGAAAAAAGEQARAAHDVDCAQFLLELSGGVCGFVSLGRFHPPGDMARVEVFGTGGIIRCDFLDPAEGVQAQLDAVRRQAEDFAVLARGGPGRGAMPADAIAALAAAEQATAAIPAMASGRRVNG